MKINALTDGNKKIMEEIQKVIEFSRKESNEFSIKKDSNGDEHPDTVEFVEDMRAAHGQTTVLLESTLEAFKLINKNTEEIQQIFVEVQLKSEMRSRAKNLEMAFTSIMNGLRSE